MHSWFDVLQDKGDSPYFTIAEKTQFLNRAQTKFVNELMYKNLFASGQQPEKNAIPYNSMESIQAGEDALEPLIFGLYTNATDIMNKYGSAVSTLTKKLQKFLKKRFPSEVIIKTKGEPKIHLKGEPADKYFKDLTKKYKDKPTETRDIK